MTGLSPSISDENTQGEKWVGSSGVRGPRRAKLPLLTIGMIGLQVVWSAESGYASPYLMSLGLSKSLMSMVFVAGPLSGLFLQPLIGVMSDRSKSQFGRRRPYMLVASFICFGALLLLGFSSPIASIFTGSNSNQNLTTALAVGAIFFIDFSTNAETGNAWVGRMFGIGGIIGFFIGNITLPDYFPFFGHTQLQVLCILTGIVLLFTQGVAAYSVTEKILVSDLIKDTTGTPTDGGILSAIKEVLKNIRMLPSVIRQICFIQFFSSVAWYPVWFYTSLWVSEIYIRAGNIDDDQNAAGTRAGNRAMLYASLVSMVVITVAPFFVVGGNASTSTSSIMPDTFDSPIDQEPWWKCRIENLWTVSLATFACSLGSTLFVDSVGAATFLVAVSGFAAAITSWAPYALLGEAIRSSANGSEEFLADGEVYEPIPMIERHTRASIDRRALIFDIARDGSQDDRIEHEGDDFPNDNIQEDDDEDTPDNQRLLNGPWDSTVVDRAGNIEGKAGAILGILNIFMVVPQFLVTGLASLVFALSEPGRPILLSESPPLITNGTLSGPAGVEFLRRADGAGVALKGYDSIGLLFRIGGVSAAIASILCWRLARDVRRR